MTMIWCELLSAALKSTVQMSDRPLGILGFPNVSCLNQYPVKTIIWLISLHVNELEARREADHRRRPQMSCWSNPAFSDFNGERQLHAYIRVTSVPVNNLHAKRSWVVGWLSPNVDNDPFLTDRYVYHGAIHTRTHVLRHGDVGQKTIRRIRRSVQARSI